MSYLVVLVVDCEVSNTDDDLMKQVLAGVMGAIPQQGADNVSESQREALSS